ncbi:Rho guanine nucleotide exchange factor [Marasmius sp. AFHP31]|nr:Rho guanine nucleotide exchange factor [Marasmius sp. AFHP31]
MNLWKLHSTWTGSIPTDDLENAQRVVQDALDDEHKYREIIETKGDHAQKWLDLLQAIAERPTIAPQLQSSILKMILRLSKRSGLCPTSLVIKNVKKQGRRVGWGAFGDVWKGKIGDDTLVCLKVVRIHAGSDAEKMVKDYMREAIGDLHHYLKETPRDAVDHLSLAYDIAAGLAYLHSKEIVHGDLKGVNVLIKVDGSASIGDFGLSRIAESHTTRFTASTSRPKGTMRWISPELLDPESTSMTSKSSDIYAYGCVCYEIFAGNVPFHNLMHDAAVILAVVVKKQHPDRPLNVPELTNSTWEIMVSCWQHDQRLRPSAADVLARIGELESPKTGAVVQLRPALYWDTLSRMPMWPNVKYPSIDTGVFDCVSEEVDFGRAVANSVPRSGQFHLHPWLDAQNWSDDFLFLLSSHVFNPQMVQSRFINSDGSVGEISRTKPPPMDRMLQTATSPGLSRLRVICDLIPNWPIDIPYEMGLIENPGPSALRPDPLARAHGGTPLITLRDVLLCVHRVLHTSISHADWAQLTPVEQGHVSSAYGNRCRAAAHAGAPMGTSGADRARFEQAEMSQGVKKVDFLLEKVWFRGCRVDWVEGVLRLMVEQK